VGIYWGNQQFGEALLGWKKPNLKCYSLDFIGISFLAEAAPTPPDVGRGSSIG